MAPVLTYKDLSRDDISLLTEALSLAGDTNLRSSSAHARQASLIGNLPSHLKSWLPRMAPGCPQHKRLNLIPLADLARQFQHEATHSVSTIWAPLRDAGAFTRDQVTLLGALESVSHLASTGCSACWLELIGANPKASTALGAFILGRVSPEIYQKSRRLVWIEESRRRALSQGMAEFEIRRMWEAGIALRRVRKDASVVVGENRGYVAEYVRRAKDLGGPASVRSQNASRSNLGHADVDDRLEGVRRGDGVNAGLNPPEHRISRKPVPQSTQPPRAAEPPRLSRSHERKARVASSVYSQAGPNSPPPQPASPNPSEWWNSPGPTPAVSTPGSQIIDLYRHSHFPDNTAFDARSSTDTRRRSPVEVGGAETPQCASQASSRHGVTQGPKVGFAELRGRSELFQRRMAVKSEEEIPFGGSPSVRTVGLHTYAPRRL